jgi:Mn2+/Fe2+ NRAMP family transporter
LVGLVVTANTINLGADLGAMGAALKLLVGGPILLYVALFGIFSVLLEVFVRYSRYVSLLKWLIPTCVVADSFSLYGRREY